MKRYLLTVLATLLMAAIAAFFFYVALVPLVLASMILLGLAVMFALGVYVGTESLTRLGNSFHLRGRFGPTDRLETQAHL
jgi:hypothetical protein